jgi:hypothetical protein
MGAWRWARRWQAPRWPSTQGTVMWAKASYKEEDRQKGRVGELAYSYGANSQYYSAFHRIKARSESRAEKRVEGGETRMVVVRYHPKNVAVSVLLKEDQPGGQLGNQLSGPGQKA